MSSLGVFVDYDCSYVAVSKDGVGSVSQCVGDFAGSAIGNKSVEEIWGGLKIDEADVADVVSACKEGCGAKQATESNK